MNLKALISPWWRVLLWPVLLPWVTVFVLYAGGYIAFSWVFERLLEFDRFALKVWKELVKQNEP